MQLNEENTMDTAVKLDKQESTISKNKPVLEVTGKAQLNGEVRISGAKNSALAIMAGTLLCDGDCHLTNVPDLVDITRMAEVLEALGLKITKKNNTIDVDARNIVTSNAPYDKVSKLRASFFAIGPMLARLGTAQIPLPGGCAIGSRPVELHVRGLQAMGANVTIEHGIVNASVLNKSGRLKGAKIFLDYPSVGATETIMMAATLAEGETIIDNAAQEPEIVDLANFCIEMGAKITGAGTKTIVVSGVEKLHSVDYAVIADRIEAGTFLVAGAITHSEISLTHIIPQHLAPVMAKLQDIGCKVLVESANRIRLIPGELKGTDIETLPYPGFPTDMQAQFMALLTLSEGNSVITETVFENRLQHVAELKRMGADIKVKGNSAIIKGVPMLSGAPVMSTDLRASAALVIAGLAADGKTIVQGLHHLDRGYENIEEKFRALGAKMRRLDSYQK